MSLKSSVLSLKTEAQSAGIQFLHELRPFPFGSQELDARTSQPCKFAHGLVPDDVRETARTCCGGE